MNATGTEVDDRPADGAASEEPVESADDATDAALPSNQFTPTVARNNVALAPTAAAEAADGDLAQQAQAAADESATPDGDGEIDAVAAAKDAAAAEALEATATAPAPSTSASAASALTAPLRDRIIAPAPLSRRAEGRSAEADGKAGPAERALALDGASVQARATGAAATSTDGSIATLLSAQMAGQMGDQPMAEGSDAAFSATLAAVDEVTNPAAGPVSASAVDPAAVETGTVHGSRLAASTIETTAQLAAQIARRLEGRSTRFDMALTPDDLGRVDVSLDIDADGGLTARLAFDNPLAATELRGRADELRRQLQDAGFTVGADSLSFSEREAGSSNGGSDQRFGQGAARAFVGAGRLTDDLEAVAVTPAWISHSQTPQGVDLKV